MKRAMGSIWENRKTIMITFEIFWIVIFLLNMLGDQAGSQVPQFVYVNF